MRVEVTEDNLKSDGYCLERGDSIRVPDEVGTRWCALGWARDVEGKVPSGERVVLDARLDVHTAVQGLTSEEVSHG